MLPASFSLEPSASPFAMRFQWLFWLIVVGIGAALPWLVRDWIVTGENAGTPANSAPRVAGEQRSYAAVAADFLRERWLSVTGGLKDDDSPASTGGDEASRAASGRLAESERAAAAAGRVLPKLEPALAAKGLEIGDALFLRVFKESKELEVWMRPKTGGDYVLFKTYPICRWSGDLGPKLKEGDGQAPEGFYFVTPGRMNPNSRFHLSFDIGFPNEFDESLGRTGSYLMIHGDCVSIGCYAMTDAGIEEIYTLAAAALARGQRFFRVHCFPFRMTDERMEALREGDKWFDFWANLKEGYDYFEFLGRPPDVSIAGGRYRFE